MPCPGVTKTGKPCGRKIPPGAAICENHFREQEKAKAREEHCRTKRSNEWARTPCPKPRHGDHEWCKRCIDAEQEHRERRAALEAEQAAIRQEDQALRDFPHWPALKRFVEDTVCDEVASRSSW
jgi:hypothetical protein